MLDVEIDELTESIQDALTGDRFDTRIKVATVADIRRLSKKWTFDWKQEHQEREVFRLIAPAIGATTQGLISLERHKDHVFVNLLESHPQNVGRSKRYAGVPGNLMAFAAKLSFDDGHGGFVVFVAKTELIEHYQVTLGAVRIGRSARMIINEPAAMKLIDKYFGGYDGTNT